MYSCKQSYAMDSLESKLEDEFFDSILNERSPIFDFPNSAAEPNNNLQSFSAENQAIQQEPAMSSTTSSFSLQPNPFLVANAQLIAQQQQQLQQQQLLMQQQLQNNLFMQEAMNQFATIGSNVLLKSSAQVKREEFSNAFNQFLQFDPSSSFRNGALAAPNPALMMSAMRANQSTPLVVASPMNMFTPQQWNAGPPMTTAAAASLPIVSSQQHCFFNDSSSMNNNNTIITTPPIIAQQQSISSSLSPPPLQPPPSSQNLIKLIEGYNRTLLPDETPIGGKDNTKSALPRQVIELNVQSVPKHIPVSSLSCKVFVCGYHKVAKSSPTLNNIANNHGMTRVILGEVAEKRFEPFTANNDSEQQRYVAIFDKIICKFSSQNNGQKLCLRFFLCDANKTRICFVDSEDFETITKRGIDKRKKRKRGDDESEPSVHHVEPSLGLTTQRQLVKITGHGLVCPPVQQVQVMFGERESPEVHSVKRNVIICETPVAEKAGLVNVLVSFDAKRTYLKSNAKYRYVDPSDEQGVKDMIHALSDPFKPIVHSSPYSSSSPSSNNHDAATPLQESPTVAKSPMQSSATVSIIDHLLQQRALHWLQNVDGTSDSCGYTLLHHACARGYYELVYCLLVSQQSSRSMSNSMIDACDHFGYTALDWALWGGHDHIATLLVVYGAELTVQTLHALQVKHTDALKRFLFWYLKNDDHQFRSRAETVLHSSIVTAISNSSLASAVKHICERRVNEVRVPVSDLKLRSGSHNGKTISEVIIVNQQVLLALTCSHLKKQFVIHLNVPSDTLCSAEIRFAHEDIAFVIMERSQARIEFTLKRAPTVVTGETKKNDDEHVNQQQLDHLKSIMEDCLSFFIRKQKQRGLNSTRVLNCRM